MKETIKNLKKIMIGGLIGCFCVGLNYTKLQIHALTNGSLTPEVKYETDLDTYYEDILGFKGNDLLENLAALMTNTHQTYTSYGEVKGGNALSDEDPNNPNNIILFYSNYSISNAWSPEIWNREHVWCKSLSGGLYTNVDDFSRNAGSDLHQIKPAATSVNTSRNNKLYANLNKQGTEITYNGVGIGCYSQNDLFEPRDDIKGDIARTLMYMYTHYSNEVNNSTEGYNGYMKIENIMYTPIGTAEASWKELLHWNELDPVDSFEKHRNDYVSSVQGNRNPFIDHPEFASMIWDDKYEGEGSLIDLEGSKGSTSLCLSSYSMQIPVGNTYNLSSFTLPSSNVSYYSTNPSIASVDENGLITPLHVGNAKIIVTSEFDTKECFINVCKESAKSSVYKDKEYNYKIATYEVGKQYAANEAHELDENVTLYVDNGYFSTEIRLYSSSTHNSVVYTNELPTNIEKLDLVVGNAKDTLLVYGSGNGENYELVDKTIITSSSYNKYSVDFSNKSYRYFKLDVEGANQLRITDISIYYQNDVISEQKASKAIDNLNPYLFKYGKDNVISYNNYEYYYCNLHNENGSLASAGTYFYLGNSESYGYIESIEIESNYPVCFDFSNNVDFADKYTTDSNSSNTIIPAGDYEFFKLYSKENNENEVIISNLTITYMPIVSIKFQKGENNSIRVVAEINHRYYQNVGFVINNEKFAVNNVKKQINVNDSTLSSNLNRGCYITYNLENLKTGKYVISAYIIIDKYNIVYSNERTLVINDNKEIEIIN